MTVFIITYENKHFRQWKESVGFSSYKKAKKHLIEKGFVDTKDGLKRDPKGWCMGLKAYIEPLQII